MLEIYSEPVGSITHSETVAMTKSITSLPLILKRHWLPAAIAFTSVMAGAIAYLKFTPQLYEAKAQWTLDDRQISRICYINIKHHEWNSENFVVNIVETPITLSDRVCLCHRDRDTVCCQNAA